MDWVRDLGLAVFWASVMVVSVVSLAYWSAVIRRLLVCRLKHSKEHIDYSDNESHQRGISKKFIHYVVGYFQFLYVTLWHDCIMGKENKNVRDERRCNGTLDRVPNPMPNKCTQLSHDPDSTNAETRVSTRTHKNRNIRIPGIPESN
jgi:hypothetical protein